MSYIITISNQKGGVGKTTLSLNLAFELARQFHVLVIDADPQGSALDWAAVREQDIPFTVMGMARPILHKEIPKLADNYNFIIIDGPPRVSDITRSAIMASHSVIIPVQPSPYDVWAAAETVDLVKEAQIVRESLKAFFVQNRVIKRTRISKDVMDALKEYEIPTLHSVIHNRIAFATCATKGLCVHEIYGQNGMDEIKALAHEVMNMKNIEPNLLTGRKDKHG